MGAPSGRAARIVLSAARVWSAALAAPGHTPQLVVAEAVAAVEVADTVGAVVGGRQPVGLALPAPSMAPWQGRIDSGPNWSNAKHRSGNSAGHVLDPVQFGVTSGSVDSFQVRVRWKEMWCSRRICRSRSRPI